HRGEFRKVQRPEYLRQPPPQWRRAHRPAEAPRVRHDRRQRPPDQTAFQATTAGFLYVIARNFDQMHVIDAGWARRHAGKTRKTAVDMRRDFGLGVEAPFE